jgi:beta-N-acetylhexosaminidase
VPVDAAHRLLARMSSRQKIAQLLMTATVSTKANSAVLSLLRSGQIGSVILNQHSQLGVAGTKAVTDTLKHALLAGAPGLFLATDQEGGQIQDLNGPGFAAVPSALQQGQLAPATLQARAQLWAVQLRSAGINLNLAPVLDTVPSPAAAQSNAPIGQLDREYGYTPEAVTAHGVAFVRGQTAARIAVAVKHFPGLGRVRGNTDFSGGVTDTVTTADDAYLDPFGAAVRAGVPFVMISTAIYTKIDPDNPAAFSRRIITTLLRGQLGFRGVVISDDVGGAAQVADVAVGQRAVRFIAAGGDIVLTVNPAQIPTMTAAVLSAMKDPAFTKLVDAAALRVLEAKQALGLI